MKTHLDKFIELYKEFGINLEVEETIIEDEEVKVICCYSSDDGFEGYSAFFTTIIFDKEGNFKTQGFWEC